jgi:hypothetical protein
MPREGFEKATAVWSGRLSGHVAHAVDLMRNLYKILIIKADFIT